MEGITTYAHWGSSKEGGGGGGGGLKGIFIQAFLRRSQPIFTETVQRRGP